MDLLSQASEKKKKKKKKDRESVEPMEVDEPEEAAVSGSWWVVAGEKGEVVF